VVIMGPAGSGKTSLAAALGRWVEESVGLSVGYANLDPAVEFLPYRPDFDARGVADARELMRREGLGPNGALLRAVEILAERADYIADALSALGQDYVIVDTPGQLDMFVFHDFGPKIVEGLQRRGRSLGLFLWEASTLATASGSASLFLLTLFVRLRLQVPVIPVVTKIDAAQPVGGTFFDTLEKVRQKLGEEPGALSSFVGELYSVLREYSIPARIVGVSSRTGAGLSDLYGLIHEVFCACGDLT